MADGFWNEIRPPNPDNFMICVDDSFEKQIMVFVPKFLNDTCHLKNPNEIDKLIRDYLNFNESIP